jgi:AcrR family transcriptional regulator
MSPRPYRSETRKAAADLTRTKIVAAARDVLVDEEGAGRFSIDAVAKKADVSRMTVYHQFGTREALIEAVMDDLAQRGGLPENLRKAFSTEDPHKMLAQFVTAFIRFNATDPMLIRRLMLLSQTEDAIARVHRQERRRYAARNVVQRLVAAGLVRAGSSATDAADVLYVLTGFDAYEALTIGDRSRTTIERLLQATVQRALGLDPRSS